MIPSDMDDLQVPGAGPVAETLLCIQNLCVHMKEARPACVRVTTRLQNLQQELRRMSEEGHPPALESLVGYVEVFANFLQFLRKYHNKHLIFRVAENQKMTERLKQVNEQLARVFAALDVGAPTNWDTSWQIDCRLQEQALTNAVDKSGSDIRSLQSSRAQLEALLTLKFEVEKRADRHDGVSMILIQSLMEKVSAGMKRTEVTLPPWFLPLYEVEVEVEPFAGGHFGKVHRGVMGSGEKVVVEFFSVDELVMDERAQVQVEKELGGLFQLRHSNVVKMLGGSHVSTPPFVVYEDTDNGNLGCFLARSDKNKKKVWSMLHDAALCLDYLHKKGLAHGHLKLSNILVGTDGQAKLADFGLNAMRRYSALSKKFPDAVAEDDLRWRAPEYLVKGPTATSDVYALGMCIIEAVTDEVPFASVDPASIGETTPEQPDEMNETEWELVLAMTNEDPSKRISLHDVIENLKEFVARAACEEPNGEGRTCVACSSVVAVSSRFCSQCGTQLPPSTSSQLRFTFFLPDSVYISKDTTVPALIAASSIVRIPRRQEQVLLLLFLASIDPEKRKKLHEADGVSALIRLVKNGLSHFTQLCALGCLYNIKTLTFRLPETTWDEVELQRIARITTIEERSSLLKNLCDGDDEGKEKAIVFCACIAAAGGYENLNNAGVIPPIVALLKTGDDNQQLLAANSLGHIAQNETNSDVITRDGVVTHLVSLLLAGSAVQAEQSGWALCRLSKFRSCSKLVTATAVIPSLVTLLRTGVGTRRLHSVWTLGNIASSTEAARNAIANAGVIPDLVELLRSGRDELREHAIRLLANLTVSTAYRASIATQTTLPQLVTLLKDGSEAEKLQSTRILANSTVDPNVRGIVTNALEAVTPALITLLRDGNERQKMYAAQALANLSLDHRARIFIVGKDAIPHCVALLRNGNESQKECAACLLANLAIEYVIPSTIATTVTLCPLVALLRTGNVGQKSHAVRALANLVVDNENAQVIADVGAVAPLVALLHEDNASQKRYAVCVLAYLASASESARSAIANAGAIPTLVELLRTGSDATKADAAVVLGKLAMNSIEHKTDIVNRGVGALLEELRNRGTEAQKRKIDIVLGNLRQDNTKRRRKS